MSIILLQIIEMITFKKFNSEGVFQGINRPCKLSKKKKNMSQHEIEQASHEIDQNFNNKKNKIKKNNVP